MSTRSEVYAQMIGRARKDFTKLLAGRTEITLTEAKYKTGCDALPEDLQDMVQGVFGKFLKEMQYELSYNQICQAFFGAAKELGILRIT